MKVLNREVIIIKRDIYKKIIKIIKKYDEIVLARHISPDPDALASQIALRESIKLTYPHKKVYAVGAKVNKFKYLGTLDKPDLSSLKNALLIVLDVPNYERLDGVDTLEYKAILKVDHHPSEDIIGDVDWTDEKMSSTCEMVAGLIMNSNLLMNRSIAENLFIGMVFDSDRFLLANTSVNTFKTVYELLEKNNLEFTQLYENLYLRSIEEERFRAYITNHLKISENKFGYLYVPVEDLKKFNVEATSVSNQVNNFNFIDELICWMFVVYDERSNIYKANIRSRGPIINEVVGKYNGGGHKFASGCRSVEYQVMEDLAKDLDEVCKNYNSKEENE